MRTSDHNKSRFMAVGTGGYNANQHKYWSLLPVLAVLCYSMEFSPFSCTHFFIKSLVVKEEISPYLCAQVPAFHHQDWWCTFTYRFVTKARWVCVSNYFQSEVIDIHVILSRLGHLYKYQLPAIDADLHVCILQGPGEFIALASLSLKLLSGVQI